MWKVLKNLLSPLKKGRYIKVNEIVKSGLVKLEKRINYG